MISADIRSLRGCRAARIDLAPTALIAGRNGAGKSSIASGLAAAVTGTMLPRGMAKQEAGALVLDGAEYGVAAVERGDGSARVSWPRCERETIGEPPRASEIAAGLQSLAGMSTKDRAATVAQLLRAAPNRDDLGAALREHRIDVDLIWKRVTEQGWDGLWRDYKNHGAARKGAWEEVTGERYGSAKAPQWLPAHGWSPDLADANDDDLAADVAAKRRGLEELLASNAVDEARRAEMQAAADRMPELEKAANHARARLAEADMEVARRQHALAALPPHEQSASGIPCPECSTLLDIKPRVGGPGWVVSRAVTVSAAELKQRRLAWAGADGALSRAKSDRIVKVRDDQEARIALDQAARAVAQLATVGKRDEAAIAQARHMLDGAQMRAEAHRRKRRADQLAADIAQNQVIIDALAPDGLRRIKMTRAIEAFNGTVLGPLCEAAGWQSVALDPDLDFRYGRRPYALVSRSERYRVRIALQVAVALIDRSELVIIDDAEILDAPGRNGLFALLAAAKLPALVCMTLSKIEQEPDLDGAGIGRAYWVEQGTAAPLAEIREAAQ